MSSITVTIKTPGLEYQSAIRPNVRFSQLIGEIIVRSYVLEKNIFQGEAVPTLWSERLGRALNLFETPYTAGISPGDILALRGFEKTGYIEVTLRLNGYEFPNTRLPFDRKLSDFLEKINSGVSPSLKISRKLWSQNLLRILDEDETPRSVGLRGNDLLSILESYTDILGVKVIVIFEMSNIRVDLPRYMTIDEIVRILIQSRSFSRENNLGETFEYVLGSKTCGMEFSDTGKTLADYGVLNGHNLFLTRNVTAGGGPRLVNKSPLGLRLDSVKSTQIKTLQTDKHALNMTLHSYRDTLDELENTYVNLNNAEKEIERLHDRMKDKNIATGLFILGQIQIGFGTNMITGNAVGGWFMFFTGIAVTIGALYYSFIGTKRNN